jgi:succinate-semialdehyde dehydrogenase/glutarate-semialdehyde dehydrogenase
MSAGLGSPPIAGASIDVTNPATGEVIGTVPACGEAETMRAIDAAARRSPSWRGWT